MVRWLSRTPEPGDDRKVDASMHGAPACPRTVVTAAHSVAVFQRVAPGVWRRRNTLTLTGGAGGDALGMESGGFDVQAGKLGLAGGRDSMVGRYS